jgi:hypothetical protein
MKPFPPPPSARRAVPAGRPLPRPLPASGTRSTVLQSLLLSPDGGNRHGTASPRPRTR